MFVLHASLLLIAVGALVGASLGFTGYTMWVAEGESSSDCTRRDYSHMVQAENPHNAGQQMLQPYLEHKSLPFSIHLDRFRIGISKKGSPTAYESTVRVLQKGKVAKRFTIATNRPLRYRGISFYQNDFSMASVTIKMAGPDGKETLATWPVQEMPGGGGGRIYRVVPSDAAKITTPDGTIFVIPAGLAPNYDPELPWEIPSRGDLPANPAVFLFAHPMRGDSMAGMQMPEEIGWVSKSQSQKFSGYTFSLDRAQLESALGVTRNPGMPIVYVGFMALVLGLVFAFYVRHRIIRVCLCDEGGQSRVAIGGTERLGEADFDREFGRIEQALSAREGS
jgi:cytochrome c biogenesis protein